ncbi:MAG: carboxymuconolactone decarboxylase family protein [Betaproteobacteria bacterium]|nr:carboxymuconolactone decarboxylase family protein [Betaproteobacteria bacterium]
MARIEPLPADLNPDLQDTLQTYRNYLGYVPNSVLIMQHRPRLVKALAQMASAVWDKETSEVSLGFKRLVAYMASRTHGCNYSMAHAAEAAHRAGMDDAKLEAVVDYKTSPLYTEAERVALDFAVAAASQPNGVTDALFRNMKKHWTDAQIVEIAGAVALNGFLNRWNDTMAVPLEPEPVEFGEKHLARHGWRVGKHR